MLRFLIPLAMLAPALRAAEPPPVPRVQAVPLPHHITSFQLDGRELTACHYDPADARPFWYPLRASAEPSLTRMGHPHDPHGHSHHNSVWISHNEVNGLDFWGDRPAKRGRIVTVEIPREGYADGDEAASMRQINHWLKDEDGSLQLIELRRTEVRPLDGALSWFLIIDLELSPPKGQTVRFGATGFGLVAVRVARSLGVRDGGGRLLNSEGQVNEKAMFRLPARWCDASGRIVNGEKGLAGVTLMNHPMNPRHPTAFHVRDDGWMGACLNLDEPLALADGEKLRLRYGLWVHDGQPGSDEIEQHWQRFRDLPVADLAPGKP